jgi:hypothetical protein
VDGAKTIETRNHTRFSWLDGQYIGIHAARSFNMADAYAAAKHYPVINEYINQYFAGTLPLGALLAKARVAMARPVPPGDMPKALLPPNTHTPGLFGLYFSEVFQFRRPMPARGMQGVWAIPDTEIKAFFRKMN